MIYLGVDIGGMSIKVGAVDERGVLLSKVTDVTPLKDPDKAIELIASLCRQAVEHARLNWSDVAGIGAGAPGTVDGDVVTYATNIGWYGVPFCDKLSALTGVKVAVGNDANCALLAEVKFGAAKGYKDVAMVTLGTGVGTAFLCGGTLLLGNGGAAGEGGHMRTKSLGNRCSCGRLDCWELYASASALERRAQQIALHNPSGILSHLAKEHGKATGKIFFDALRQGDKDAEEQLAEFQQDVADGLINIANLFRPQLIVVGGGIAAQPRMIAPLEDMVNAQTLGGEGNPHVKVVAATMGNDAGIVGAAVQVM